MASSTGSDVFVSFRGEEVRRAFVSHIYRSLERKGIRTFKYETELNLELEPSEIHLAAIRASKIAIVVVSKNYVSSPSVLRELKEILNYLRNGHLTVFPIYYGVDDCDVKSQAEEFCTYQEQNIDEVEVSATAWRNALLELACISGEHSNNWEDDAELILKITNDIWDKLSSSRFCGLVGMDLRMRRVYELLSLDSKDDEVREIGIWGRAGLGKRTLAKFVYQEISHCFDVCVLLEDVNTIHHSYGHNALVLSELLQTKLIQASGSLHVISPDDTAWLTDQRVLLVVGGVDKLEKLDILREHIKLFGPGSRVIVTCLDKKLLLACGVTFLYQVESLEFYEALELLNLHAFKNSDPLKGYEHFLARAIKIGNGYPSVIATVGSDLCDKPKEEWEKVLSRYEQSSDEGTTGIERTSSDASVGSKVFGRLEEDWQMVLSKCERSSDENTSGTEISNFHVSNDKDKSLSGNTAINCVGMECHMKAVSGLMELESENEVRIVGIWGVGGVGKLTLARCVYKETMRYFHIHVFLENVGKIYQDHGPSGLHEELLWNNIQREALSVRSSKKGFDVTKPRLRNHKVLLIVDGVDNNEQIEDVQKVATWFGAGSRVMVTTRDEKILVANGLTNIYEVKCLRVHEALQLFYHFAFTEQAPSTRFKRLSVRAVQLAGRIPLSLKVLGSFLCGKSGHEWERVLQKLERQRAKDKEEVAEASTDVGVTRDKETYDYRNVSMAVGSDVTDPKVIIVPEEKSHVTNESRSVYEQECIWGTMSIDGNRPEMQDAVIALPHFLKIPIEMLMGDHEAVYPCLTHIPSHFFGLYDGHGGSLVVDYCRDRVHFALAEEIEGIKNKSCNSESSESRQVQWKKVFTNCFVRIVDEVAGKMSSPSTGSSDKVLEAVVHESIGSTAVVALVCSSHIIVSNCGNSSVVLLRGKESMHLSVDHRHRPDREDKYARIEKTGGKVGARISFGIHDMSRSIDDDEYLEPYVIPDPNVNFMQRAREDELIILAGDGLWCVMSYQEACNIARNQILKWHKKNGSLPLAERGVREDHACQVAADYLSRLARQKGSKDNVSIIVVDLKAQRKFKTRS